MMKTFKDFNNIENPFLDWKSSFGEIRDNVLKEEDESILQHTGTKVPSDTGYRHFEYDSIHDHPDIIPTKHRNLEEHEIHSIADYTGAKSSGDFGHRSSGNMNAYLRNRMGDKRSKIIGNHDHTAVETGIHQLSSVFTPETTNRKKIVTFTGIPSTIGNKLLKVKSGDSYHLPGFTSSTTSRKVAESFAGSYKVGLLKHHIIKFHLDPGVGLSVPHYSRYPDENEIVLHHGTKVTYVGRQSYTNSAGRHIVEHHLLAHSDHLPLEQYPHDYG